MDDPALTNMLEAARSAPSWNNSQPWRFIVGRRSDAVFRAMLETLLPGNRSWAASASALVAAVARHRDPAGAPLPWARYDTGQAMAYLTFQVHAEGLCGRQIAGFDSHALRAAFRISADFDPCVIMAVGRLAGSVAAATERPDGGRSQRHRDELQEIVLDVDSPTRHWARPADVIPGPAKAVPVATEVATEGVELHVGQRD